MCFCAKQLLICQFSHFSRNSTGTVTDLVMGLPLESVADLKRHRFTALIAALSKAAFPELRDTLTEFARPLEPTLTLRYTVPSMPLRRSALG